MNMLILQKSGDLEIPIIFHCNLNCNYCAHMSQFMSQVPIVSVSTIEKQCQDWCNKILPKIVRIMGGEPLLHPNLEEIVHLVYKYWHPIPIKIATNGMLLDKMSTSFFDFIRKTTITLRITLHDLSFKDDLEYFLSQIQCNYVIINKSGNKRFIKYYNITDTYNNLTLPYSNSSKAVSICQQIRRCHTLMDNQLYHCGLLAYRTKAYQYNIIKDKRILDYQPGLVDMTDIELNEWYNNDFTSVCTMCPEYYEYNQHKFNKQD